MRALPGQGSVLLTDTEHALVVLPLIWPLRPLCQRMTVSESDDCCPHALYVRQPATLARQPAASLIGSAGGAASPSACMLSCCITMCMCWTLP